MILTGITTQHPHDPPTNNKEEEKKRKEGAHSEEKVIANARKDDSFDPTFLQFFKRPNVW